MTTAIVAIIFIAGIWMDYLPKRKTLGKKDRAVYLVFLAGAFLILFLESIHLPPPSPNALIKRVVGFLFFRES